MFTSLEKRPSVPAVAPPSCHPPGSAGGPPLLSEALIGHRAPGAGRTLVALCWAAIGVLGVSGARRGSSCYFPVTSLSFPGVHLLPTGPLPPVLPLSARVVFLRHNSSHLTCLLRAFPGFPEALRWGPSSSAPAPTAVVTQPLPVHLCLALGTQQQPAAIQSSLGFRECDLPCSCVARTRPAGAQTAPRAEARPRAPWAPQASLPQPLLGLAPLTRPSSASPLGCLPHQMAKTPPQSSQGDFAFCFSSCLPASKATGLC